MNEMLDMIYKRRAARLFTEEAISEDVLWQILEAARWAPAAHNRRVHRYVCLTDERTIRQIKLVSRDMAGTPTEKRQRWRRKLQNAFRIFVAMNPTAPIRTTL